MEMAEMGELKWGKWKWGIFREFEELEDRKERVN